MAEIVTKKNCTIKDGIESCEEYHSFSIGKFTKNEKWTVLAIVAIYALVLVTSFFVGWSISGDSMIGVKYFSYTGAMMIQSLPLYIPGYGIYWATTFSARSVALLSEMGIVATQWLEFVTSVMLILGIIVQVVIIVTIIIFVVTLVSVRR